MEMILKIERSKVEGDVNSVIYNDFILIDHMSQNIIKHYPVMAANVLQRIKKSFSSKPIKIADCNFGFGGHSRLILKHFPKTFIQAYDLDPKVIEYFKSHYQQESSQDEVKRLVITQQNFSSISKTKVYDKFDVILADFGFNSFHLETERGFSWMKNEELDMRYSSSGRTCSQIINHSSQLEIMSILQRYGDLKGTKHIAEAIVAARPITTTSELRDAVVGCFQDDKTRKIAQVFQAFRIVTNNEIKDIEQLCNSLQDCLNLNGLFLGITFHSIERDTIHNFIREKGKQFSKIQVESPSNQEISQNSKSRSAKMLVFQKLK